MDNFFIQTESISNLVLFLFSFISFYYLFTLKKNSLTTRLLSYFFLSYALLAAGFVYRYSFWESYAAYYVFLSLLFMFGLVSMIQFAYRFPKNNRPKEARFVLVISLSISLITYLSIFIKLNYPIKFSVVKKYYMLTAQKIEPGEILVILFVLFAIITLIRQSIYYARASSISKLNLGGYFKLLATLQGKIARVHRSFALAMLLLLVLSVFYILSRAGLISHLFIDYFYNALSLLMLLAFVLVYVNNASDRTSIKAKIISISLVTVLIAISVVNSIATQQATRSFIQEKFSETIAYSFLVNRKISYTFSDDIIFIKEEGILVYRKKKSTLNNWKSALVKNKNNYSRQDFLFIMK